MRWPASGSGRRPAGPLAAGLILFLLAQETQAHGPTLQASFSGLRPERIAISAGETVHFRRAGGSQVALTVVSDSGLFESPALDAAGWHYTFEQPGEYAVHLKENPSARAIILVGEARPGPSEPPSHPGHEQGGHEH